MQLMHQPSERSKQQGAFRRTNAFAPVETTAIWTLALACVLLFPRTVENRRRMMRLIGVDVGGTSRTSSCRHRDRSTGVHKVSTTPDDPSRGVMRASRTLRQNGIPLETIDTVFHGTTIATNAVLEHKGARTGMITNERLSRHPAHRRATSGRALLDHAGDAVAGPAAGAAAPSQGRERAADPAARRGAGAARRGGRARRGPGAAAGGVEAVAVCFLFSYLNPAHEARAQKSCGRNIPTPSSPPRRRCRRSSASSSASRRRR